MCSTWAPAQGPGARYPCSAIHSTHAPTEARVYYPSISMYRDHTAWETSQFTTQDGSAAAAGARRGSMA